MELLLAAAKLRRQPGIRSLGVVATLQEGLHPL
jgi:hypothetical protein